MENNENTNQTLSASLCTAGCGFFGNQQFDGMCSQCYKDALKRKQAAVNQEAVARATSPQISASSSAFSVETAIPTVSVPATSVTESAELDGAAAANNKNKDDTPPQSPATSTETKTKKRNRCTSCKKKVGLTGFECRCGGLFCSLHRYSDKHNCQFDYKKEGEDLIRKNNPVVVGSKLQKI